MAQKQRKSQSLLNGALILAVATMIVKVIGMFYKIPLSNMMGAVGRGYFESAYNLYIPIYTLSMAGLPVAVTKLVSQQVALKRFRDVKMTYKVAARLFLIAGILGTVVLILAAYPYAYIAKNMEAIPSIIAIAPSIFFCCMMSIYRGYYNGLRNMTPTAISQVCEAGGKLVFGLICAKAVITFGYAQFEKGLPVFGQMVSDEAGALSAIYPYSAAAASMGVTIGTVIGMIYMMLRHKIKGDGITKAELSASPNPMRSNTIVKTIIAIAIPVVLSSLVFSVTNLIDSLTIQSRLEYMISGNLDFIKQMYSTQLLSAGILDGDIKDFLYGAYALSYDFQNLIPSLTMTLGVSAIPALAAAYAVKDKRNLKTSVESVIRVTMMIALPGGLGLAILAKPILTLLYENGKSAPAITIAAPVMAAICSTIFLMAVSQPMTNILQAIGKESVPVKSLALGAIVKVVANYIFIGIPALNINGAVIGTILCYVVIVAYNLTAIMRAEKIKINFMSVFIKPLFCALLSGVAAYTSFGIANHFLPLTMVGGHSLNNIGATAVSIVFAVVIYAISMLLVGGIAKDDIIMLPKGEKIAKMLAKYGFIG
ncbi:MAG: polysaccharide biosynthesis protein [Oscillospiraceae bacterium]